MASDRTPATFALNPLIPSSRYSRLVAMTLGTLEPRAASPPGPYGRMISPPSVKLDIHRSRSSAFGTTAGGFTVPRSL